MTDQINYNRKHLHRSVEAAVVIGGLVGWWIGARASNASALEVGAFAAGVLLVPAFVMTWIDKQYLPTGDGSAQ